MTSRIAAVYARISQDPGQTEEGVGRQIKACIERIGNHADWELSRHPGSRRVDGEPWPDGVFVDNDISAVSGKRREHYERLMKAVTSGEVSVIVAASQSRMWRNRQERADGLAVLAAAKVLWDPLNGMTLDLGSAMNRSMVGLMGEFDTLEAELTAERQRAVALDHAQRGAYHGGRPFGFQRVGAEKGHGADRTLVPDPAEKAVIQEAAQRILDGDTLYAICLDLDARGIPTATGRTWAQVGTGSLRDILVAYRNVGLRAHQPGMKRRHGDEAIKHQASWEPILDPEVFEEVREILLDPSRKVSPGPARRYLLPGFLECGKCGGRMKSQTLHQPDGDGGWVSKGPRYGCDRQRGGCGGPVRSMEAVDRVVVRRVFHWLEDNGLFDAAMQAAESEDVRAVRAKRRALVRQRDQFPGFLADEIWTRAEYRQQCQRKDAEIAALDAELLRLLGTRRVMEDVPERGPKFVARWQEWEADGARGLNRRREVIAALVDRVVVHPVGKGRASDRLIQVFPAAWADDLGERKAEALPLPVPIAITGADQVREWLAARPGESFTRFEIAEALGFTPNNTHKYLQKLEASGGIVRGWAQARTDEGRAAFTYTISDGQEGVA